MTDILTMDELRAKVDAGETLTVGEAYHIVTELTVAEVPGYVECVAGYINRNSTKRDPVNTVLQNVAYFIGYYSKDTEDRVRVTFREAGFDLTGLREKAIATIHQKKEEENADSY